MLTVEKLKQVNIPINVYNRPNNLDVSSKGLQLYNDSVNLYEALVLLGITPSNSATDLSNILSSTSVDILSSTGTDTVVPAATSTHAGVMSAADKVVANSLITLSGVAANALDLGTFTGNVIPNNLTIKAALQSLETALESVPILTTGNLISTSTPLTITNGTDAVIGSGTSVHLDQSLLTLSSIGGTLDLSQIASGGAAENQILIFDGDSWVPTTYTPPVQDHNSLTGKQGGTTSQYYHLNQSVYNKLNSATTSTVIGRGASTGEVDLISVSGSLVLIGGQLRLNNDEDSPGASKYYGTDSGGIRGYYDADTFAGLTEIFSDSTANIDVVVTDPTTTPTITADLTDTGVLAGTYGSAAEIGSFTTDTKGRIVAATVIPISISSSSISNFNEAVDDQVASLLTAGSGITLTYDDTAGTLTLDASTAITGVANRIAWWFDSSTLTTDADLAFDGTYLTVGSPVSTSLSRITSRGTGTTLSTFGYVHQNSSNTEVLKIADNGAITLGALGEVFIHPDAINLSTGGAFPISVSGGNLSLYSDLTVLVEGGDITSTTPSFKSIATRSSNSNNQVNALISGTYSVALAGTNKYTDLLIAPSISQVTHTGDVRGIAIEPVISAATNFIGLDITATSHTAIRTRAGNVRFDFGSDTEGDLYYRNSSGNLTRLPIGGPSEVLGSTGTVPAWTTTAGSLPGGSEGDFLIYSSGSWVAASPITESQSGITGTSVTLAATPLTNVIFTLYRNGVYQTITDDFTISGATITMNIALVSADKITAIYYI